jgi:hypothetical protein
VLLGTPFGEQIANIGNIMGTRWELIGNLKGNMLGTKENPLSSNQNLKEKKIKAL